MVRGRPPAPGKKKGAAKQSPRSRSTSTSSAVAAVPTLTGFIVPSVADFPVPDDVPEEAVDLWTRAIEELLPRGLRPADSEMVRMLVLAAHRNRQAARLVNQHGILIKGPNGPTLNPALKLERDTRNDYARMAAEMGLTLGARTRLGLMEIAGRSLLAGIHATLDGA